jgi:hypothetical protein
VLRYSADGIRTLKAERSGIYIGGSATLVGRWSPIVLLTNCTCSCNQLRSTPVSPFDWPIDRLAAATLILIGDADGTRLEHAVEMFRRLGGGMFRDLASELPASQLAILPGTTHVGMLERDDWIASMVSRYLATPRHPGL